MLKTTESSTIYDVGMNNGDDAAYYLHEGFNVVAIEADPLLCEQAEKRFQSYVDNKQLTILNIGIGAASGAMDFWVCENKSVFSSFNKEVASRNNYSVHAVSVQVETLDAVFEEYGVPYFLKVDIEGNDKYCLDALLPEHSPQYISVEDNGSIANLEKMHRLGYSHFKFISQYNYLPVEINPCPETIEFKKKFKFSLSNQLSSRIFRKLIRSKIYKKYNPLYQATRYHFPEGASGPFGEHTLGSWLTFEEALDTHQHFRNMFESNQPSIFWGAKGYSFWMDIHGKKA